MNAALISALHDYPADRKFGVRYTSHENNHYRSLSPNALGRLCTELFSCLREEELLFLFERMIIRSFQKNTMVLYEQDDSQSLYVINKGRLKETKSQENGREVVIGMLSAGDYFGEIAMIDGGPRSTNVIATEDCELFMFQRRDILHLFTINPQLMFGFMMGLARRIRIASKKIESLALRNVYGRVTELLLDLAKPKKDQLMIDDPLTQQDIAIMVGSSREMVSRILKDLVTGDYISVKDRRITIKRTLPLEW